MPDTITRMIDAASETESVLTELQRTMTALFRCHENFSDEFPLAPEEKKLEPYVYEIFTGRANGYLEMLFVLLDSMDHQIEKLGAVTEAMYAAARKQKEEKPHD